MKRNLNEGYALPFALVVLLFLSIVAMFMMQITGDDLEVQQASIARMQDQYAAQGELEKIVAHFSTATTSSELEEMFARFGSEQLPAYNQEGSDYRVEILLTKSGVKYNVTIECELMVKRDPLRNRYAVEYTSYSISSTEIPRVQVTEPENGGAQG